MILYKTFPGMSFAKQTAREEIALAPLRQRRIGIHFKSVARDLALELFYSTIIYKRPRDVAKTALCNTLRGQEPLGVIARTPTSPGAPRLFNSDHINDPTAGRGQVW
jgi:hypothetical protein